jgi:hypothetical protein
MVRENLFVPCELRSAGGAFTIDHDMPNLFVNGSGMNNRSTIHHPLLSFLLSLLT